MQFTAIRRLAAALALTAPLAGCSFVDLTPGGDKVRVLSLNEVGRCTLLGRVSSNTKAPSALSRAAGSGAGRGQPAVAQ